MQHTKRPNQKRWHFLAALAVLPAVVLGMLGMLLNGFSSILWLQQAAAFLLCLLYARPLRRALSKLPAVILAVMLVLLLSSSMFGEGVGGAKRWINLGIFNINAASLFLPMLLVLLSSMNNFEVLLLCGAGILCFQPDLSQLTAFAAASFPILWRRGKSRGRSLLCMAVQAALLFVCLRIPTAIEPLPHSEGILHMLGQLSPVLFLSGLVSLVVIPCFWGYRFFKTRSTWQFSLTIYYAVTILFGLSGEYPIPFMGFGLSPIAGYWLAGMVAPEIQE